MYNIVTKLFYSVLRRISNNTSGEKAQANIKSVVYKNKLFWLTGAEPHTTDPTIFFWQVDLFYNKKSSDLSLFYYRPYCFLITSLPFTFLKKYKCL